MPSFEQQRARLVAEMERCGQWPERSPWIRQAVEALPRHHFAPGRLWVWDGFAYVPLDREKDEQRWAEEVYGGPYDPAVTQVTGGVPSSSLSCCAVVADMLDSLLLEEGHTVLELGTATGWNAALLAHRAGPGRVTSLELDPQLAGAARKNLAAAGIQAGVAVADGDQGWPAGAPFDRLMATYAVETVPWAWVAQVRPGGRIVTPWGRLGCVALTVADDGTSAQGWVQGLAQFMPGRTALTSPRTFEQTRGARTPERQYAMKRDVRPLHEDAHLRFALRVALPEIHLHTVAAEDGLEVQLHDGDGSWAVIEVPDGETAVAREAGGRALADAVERAWDEWIAHGRPDLYDYGLTVTDGGHRQYAWAWDPASGPRWPLPT
ncbi:methyltransferase domain-containing protein [Streptomyces albus]|uniref:methyltransferase domain-containing protein n=1 Tax=Streptomyces albus TaxID=1888 RepID=UPI0033E2EC35